MNRWCDYSCEHAAFPESPELLGACRTMAAVYCSLLKRTVPKHTACWARKEREKGAGERRHGSDENRPVPPVQGED